MRYLIAIFSFVLSILSTFAQEEASNLVEKGAIAYERGDFEGAAKAFNEALEQNGPNASLLYNLGNAHYQSGNYGQAILDYERALFLDPRASDIRTNLEMARNATTAFEEKSEPAIWEKPLHWLSLNEWFLACGIAVGLLAAVSLMRAFLLGRKGQVSLRWVTVVSLFVLAIGVSALILRQGELDRAIVLRPGTEVRLSPFSTADVVATLKEGQGVQIQEEHEGFYLLSKGWVSKEDLQKVCADS